MCAVCRAAGTGAHTGSIARYLSVPLALWWPHYINDLQFSRTPHEQSLCAACAPAWRQIRHHPAAQRADLWMIWQFAAPASLFPVLRPVGAGLRCSYPSPCCLPPSLAGCADRPVVWLVRKAAALLLS
ncbi:MAG: hypothetical protein ACLRWQ_12955 [Flavonifractor plautii]